MMQADGVRNAFVRLCREIDRFLGRRAKAYPELAQAFQLIRTEVQRARLPDLIPTPGRLPGCRHLTTALSLAKNGPMAPLALAFEQLEPSMRWIQTEHYRERLGDEYMANYGYTNVLGYDALIPHDRVIVTFLLIGPDRHYPRHHHEAMEVYFPFGGDTLWSQGKGCLAERPAGKPIHNPPWWPHEMLTCQTPLLTFCFWISPGPIQLAQLIR